MDSGTSVNAGKRSGCDWKASLTLAELVVKLFDVGGLKFGNFTMRNGEQSPVYIDMRVLWSYPDLVLAVCKLMTAKLDEVRHTSDGSVKDNMWVCGIPYQGIPIATYMCTERGMRMLLKRKQAKQYGTCRLVEGNYEKGDSVLLIDDVLMTGATLLEDIKMIRDEGLHVECVLVFIDREQGAKERVLTECGVKVHNVLGFQQVFDHLFAAKRIDAETIAKTVAYLKSNQFNTSTPVEK